MRLYKHKWRNHYTIYLNTADGFCKLNINPDGTAQLYDLVVYPESRGFRRDPFWRNAAGEPAWALEL